MWTHGKIDKQINRQTNRVITIPRQGAGAHGVYIPDALNFNKFILYLHHNHNFRSLPYGTPRIIDK